MSKAFWKSKTLWFNVLTAGAAVVGVLPLEPNIALLATTGVNIALRVVTGQPIAAK